MWRGAKGPESATLAGGPDKPIAGARAGGGNLDDRDLDDDLLDGPDDDDDDPDGRRGRRRRGTCRAGGS